MKNFLLPLLVCLVLGCSGSSPQNVVSSNEPIDVDGWNELEVSEKYEPETLERLKMHDPDLANERNWDRFMREVVVPQRRKDIPTEY